MSVAVQLQTVAFMSLCGVLMGIGFDTYQVFKGKGRFPPWFIFFLDLFFWLISVALAFYILLRVNDGVVRFPIFIGMFVGAWVYFILGSKKYIQFLLTVIKFCQWLYRTILTVIDILIVRPVMFIYKIVWMILSFVLSILITIVNFLWRILKFLISPFDRLGRKLGRRIGSEGKGFWEKVKKWIKPNKKQE